MRRLRDQTPPDNLVLQILGVKRIGRSIAMQWGIDHEDVAMQYYVKFQQIMGTLPSMLALQEFMCHHLTPFLRLPLMVQCMISLPRFLVAFLK